MVGFLVSLMVDVEWGWLLVLFFVGVFVVIGWGYLIVMIVDMVFVMDMFEVGLGMGLLN